MAALVEGLVDWAKNFKFEVGVTPFSTWQTPLMGGVIYFIIVYFLKGFRPGQETRFKSFEIVHNSFLIVLSFSIMCSTLFSAYLRYAEEGVAGVLCSQRPSEALWDGPLGAVVYVFYLSKYYDFIDTFILAARKKETIPLHLWHHAVMPFVCWSWLAYPWLDGAWWCAFVNSLIHTLMYTNYLLKSLGQKVWWAKYLTQGQIVQFITGTVYSGAFLYMQSNGFGCTGSARTAIFSNVVNFSFIVLFLGFYFKKYEKKE
eukprot:m.415922 g.415922  ORF g.415922 m.415922 type:complete len:258 (+) comp29764_c0_seq1:137-910(+)